MVIVPTLTFAATANAVVYTGAEPCFVDVDPLTGNLDPDLLRQATERLRAEGRRVTAVIPVDIFGVCADYETLLPLADELGLVVVEDAAEALGSSHPLGPAGNVRHRRGAVVQRQQDHDDERRRGIRHRRRPHLPTGSGT